MPLILGEEIEYRICLHRLILQLFIYSNLWSLRKLSN